jgi:hypothetical protein
MLSIEAVNHTGVRISDKTRSTEFFKLPGFALGADTSFEDGHLIELDACLSASEAAETGYSDHP